MGSVLSVNVVYTDPCCLVTWFGMHAVWHNLYWTQLGEIALSAS